MYISFRHCSDLPFIKKNKQDMCQNYRNNHGISLFLLHLFGIPVYFLGHMIGILL